MQVLGLDLGTNSVGWALLEENDQGEQTGIIDMGSRIFIKSVQDKTPTPKNQARRAARLARRTIQRRAARHACLENYLIYLGWLPAEIKNPKLRETILNTLGDPYQLRKIGLDHKLSTQQLGRALLHLGMRRGFLSTRVLMVQELLDDPDIAALMHELENAAYTGDTEASRDLSTLQETQAKEETEFKKDIATLQNNILAASCRTLGEYLANQPTASRKRTLRTARAMFQHELAMLFASQAIHHSDFTEVVFEKISNIMFYQRPITWDKNTIGKCSLERKLPRTHSTRLEYQRFRYLQDIAHLRWDYIEKTIDQETGEIFGSNVMPSENDRIKLSNLLEQQKTLSWANVRKTLGLDKKIKFNLEATKPKGLQGNETACDLRKITPRWDSLNPAEQNALIEDLLSYEHVSGLKKRLIQHWQFDLTTAFALIQYNREHASKRANLSLKAIRKLLPFLEQGLRYDEARVEAGYTYEISAKETTPSILAAPPDLRNPIVQKALYEVRRIVNTIIRIYGKPDAIRIELPRELTMGKAKKESFDKQQKANTKANDQAKEQYGVIRQQNLHLALPERYRRDDLLKYRLWKEQNGICPYSGATISANQIFNPEICEIEHILPYSRSLNDSYMNKVLALTSENRNKGNRTPFEAYHGAKYEQIIERTDCLPKAKREAFLCRDLAGIDTFINSQLTDTAYMSREAVHYLQQLYSNPNAVSTTKGSMTAYLRAQWGLNNLLGTEEKNRSDHRHHAIDAVVIAATNRSFYQKFVHQAQNKNIGENIHRIHIDYPWETFRHDLDQKLRTLIVSHASNRKITDALHDKTAYGIQPNDTGGQRVVYRKALDEKFTEIKISKILDPSLKDFLSQHLARFGNNPKIAFSEENRPRRHAQQNTIRHVRIIEAEKYNPLTHLEIKDKRISDKTQQVVFKRYQLGNNHHVEILRNKQTGKIRGEFISTHAAALRVSRKQAVIQRDHGEDWQFIMALCINDMVSLTLNGQKDIFRVQALDTTSQRLWLRKHIAGGKADDKDSKLGKSIGNLINTHKMSLLSINALGHLLNQPKP